MTDKEEAELGVIGVTSVKIVAEGPKAQWCVDILQERFKGPFNAVKQQLNITDNDT